MSIYTVHEPPPRAADALSGPERFVFVRDGFAVWAFLLTPLWMLWQGLWLVLAVYVAVAAILGIILTGIGASAGAVVLVGVIISLLVGLEAGTLRRFTLARRGWRNAGLVSGRNLEDAERRFFDIWLGKTPNQHGASAAPPPAPSAAPLPRMPQPEGVIGLFPEPGAQR
jgi:hypothetical protein